MSQRDHSSEFQDRSLRWGFSLETQSPSFEIQIRAFRMEIPRGMSCTNKFASGQSFQPSFHRVLLKGLWREDSQTYFFHFWWIDPLRYKSNSISKKRANEAQRIYCTRLRLGTPSSVTIRLSVSVEHSLNIRRPSIVTEAQSSLVKITIAICKVIYLLCTKSWEQPNAVFVGPNAIKHVCIHVIATILHTLHSPRMHTHAQQPAAGQLTIRVWAAGTCQLSEQRRRHDSISTDDVSVYTYMYICI